LQVHNPGRHGLAQIFHLDDVDAFTKKAIATGAKVLQPVKDQFYDDRSGTFLDPFGYKWTISTHVEDVSPEEMQRRMASATATKFSCKTSKGICGKLDTPMTCPRLFPHCAEPKSPPSVPRSIILPLTHAEGRMGGNPTLGSGIELVSDPPTASRWFTQPEAMDASGSPRVPRSVILPSFQMKG
jgi:hypothetical protein